MGILKTLRYITKKTNRLSTQSVLYTSFFVFVFPLHLIQKYWLWPTDLIKLIGISWFTMGCGPQFEKLVLERPAYTGLIYLCSFFFQKLGLLNTSCKPVYTLQGADTQRVLQSSVNTSLRILLTWNWQRVFHLSLSISQALSFPPRANLGSGLHAPAIYLWLKLVHWDIQTSG